MAKVKYKSPKGYDDVTAYLRVADAAAAIEFYKAAFGAKERYRLTMGRLIGHAELDVGNARIMLSDEFPDMAILGPKSVGNTTVMLVLYVSDADKVFERAIAAGGIVRRPLTDEFYGDRSGQIEDPFGHVWSIQERLEDVKPKEMQKRLDAMMAPGGAYAAKAVAKPKSNAKRKG